MSNNDDKELQDYKSAMVLERLNTPEELRDWMDLYLDLRFPTGTVYRDSTHGPTEAMWFIYNLLKTGGSVNCPQVTMLASRDSFKCNKKDTLLLLRDSFKKIQDIKVGDEVWSGWNWRKVTDWVDDGVKKSIRFTLKNGLELAGTPIHRYWCLRDGVTQWIQSKDILPTDLFCVNRDIKLNLNKSYNESELYAGLKLSKEINPLCDDLDITRSHDFNLGILKGLFYSKFYNNAIIGKKEFLHNLQMILIVFKFKSTIEKHKEQYILKLTGENDSNDEWIPFETKEEAEDHFFDLTVEEDHSYWSNGCISHNTLAAAALEVVCMLHFRIPMAHMAAIKQQSAKAVQYVSSFFRKLRPYLEANGWKKSSDSKTYIEWITERNEVVYLNIVTCTVAGANSEHVPLLCIGKDVDVMCKNRSESSNRIRRNIKAKSLYKNIMKGQHIEAYTLNHNTGNFEFKKVTHAYKSIKELFKVTLSNSRIIELSADHPICNIQGEYLPLRDFNLGDCVLKLHKQQLHHVTIENIESLGMQEVYDFTVEDNHNFFANQILVHNCIDEIDVIQNPVALRESSMIPSVYKGFYPLTVSLSTRKTSGGLMDKCLKQTIESGGAILRWNILDVCERITHEEARINEPKITRYISRELPMENLSPEDWSQLIDEKKINYEKLEAYAGIAYHPMLSIMKNTLVDRPQDHFGGLFKPVVAVHNNFKTTPLDMAIAQLLCDRPSTSGLVYPRFSDKENVLTPEEAFERFTGDPPPHGVSNVFQYLIRYLQDLGIPFFGGADWGYTDYTSLVIFALLPNREIWLVENFYQDKLELDDITKYASELQDRYGVEKWYVDQAYPSYIKTLKRKGLNCPKFDKVVKDGISAIQSKIVDSENNRQFYVISTPENKFAINAFSEYRWALDGRGEVVEGKPYHDKDGVSDIMDSIRYPFQNLFSQGSFKISLQMVNGKNNKKLGVSINQHDTLEQIGKKVNNEMMSNKISSLATEDLTDIKKKPKKRILLY